MAVMMSPRIVVVMGAAFGRIDQLAVEPGVGQFFDGGPGGSGADGDALLREKIQRAPPNAAGDHDICALLTQPAREKARRVGWRYQGPDVEDSALLGVHLDQREFPAAAKMFVQAAFGCGEGDDHRLMVQQLRLLCKPDHLHLSNVAGINAVTFHLPSNDRA